MRDPKRHPNPFYAVVLLVGAVFCVSGWLFFLASVRGFEPNRKPQEEGSGELLMVFFHDYGGAVLAVELVMLAACILAAVAVDRRRERGERAEIERSRDS